MRKYFTTRKTVAALDKCQLHMRNSVLILEATIDALGFHNDEFLIIKPLVQRIRTQKPKERAENTKIEFQNDELGVVILYFDDKLLS